MNIETYHAIATAILKDVEKHKFPDLLKTLVTQLSERVSNPAEASHVQQVDQTISTLRKTLPQLQSNEFPPLWNEYVAELGLGLFIGKALLVEIEQILSSNGFTPTIAHKELSEVAEEVTADVAKLRDSVAALQRFGVKLDLPAPETVELGILIPRGAVHNGLGEFASELRKINRIVGAFREAIHGDRPDLELKSVASSDFSILCLIDWETAKLIATGLSRLIETYKMFIKLREQIETLRNDGIPEDRLKPLTEHANEKMGKTVEAFVEEVETHFPDGKVTKTRRKELKIEVRGAMEEIAVKIDKGFNFEIRPGAPKPPQKGVEESEAIIADRNAMQQRTAELSGLQRQLQYLKTDGSPILSLPGLADEETKARSAAASKPDA